MRLGVIFQGGGAKLVTLLAAAEVLSNIKDDYPSIEIVATAGTSAGAFAAYALASSKETSRFRYLARIAGNKLLPKLLSLKSAGIFTLAGKAIAVARGGTIAHSSILEEFAREFVPSDEVYLYQTKLPVYICAADIANGQLIKFSSHNENDRIKEALSDSAAIPFYFRSIRSKRSYVDGGICANLPDETIFRNEDNVEAVLALSFKDDEFTPPDGVFSFLGAIMSMSISHSMAKAVVSIKRAGGTVVELPRTFGTLEFEKALATLNNDKAFQSEVYNTHARITEKLAPLVAGHTPPLPRPAVRVVSGDDPLYCALRRLRPFKCLRSESRALGFTLYGALEKRDELVHIVQYAPAETEDGNVTDGLAYVRVGIANMALRDLDQIGVAITDKHGKLVPAVSVVQELKATTGPGSSQQRYAYLHIFDKIVPLADTPVTVTQTVYFDDLLGDLRAHGVDAFRSFCNIRDAPEHFTYVATPRLFGTVKLSELHANEYRLKNPDSLPDVERSRENWSFGRVLSDGELAKVTSEVRARYAEFNVAGWHVASARENTWMGCLIERTP